MPPILPESFVQQFVKQWGQPSYEAFIHAFDSSLPTSVRVHPFKKSIVHAEVDIVPWCPYGRYLKERPVFTLDPLFHAGAYYVQEAASMFLWHILQSCFGENRDIKVLDLCGAPGGKSNLIADFLQQTGVLVTNEVIKNRAYILKANMEKSGYHNIIVTNNDPKDLGQLTGMFDLILVDAPCSGEGMFRKDEGAIREWSSDNVKTCSLRQKRILSDIIPALKPEGLLVYSTCTFNEEENIKNVSWLAREHHLTTVPIKNTETFGVTNVTSEGCTGYQFFPQTHRSEGLFISLLQNQDVQNKPFSKKKPLVSLPKKMTEVCLPILQSPSDFRFFYDPNEDVHFFPQNHLSFLESVMAVSKTIHAGINIGRIIKNDVIPHHALALALDTGDYFQKIELSKEQSLAFLQKSLHEIPEAPTGWLMVTHSELGLGWIKNLGNRINNYLPNEAKIRMDINV